MLGKVAAVRGLRDPQPESDPLIISKWPEVDVSRRNPEVEERFQKYNGVLRALREIRSRQNIVDKKPITFPASAARTPPRNCWNRWRPFTRP